MHYDSEPKYTITYYFIHRNSAPFSASCAAKMVKDCKKKGGFMTVQKCYPGELNTNLLPPQTACDAKQITSTRFVAGGQQLHVNPFLGA